MIEKCFVDTNIFVYSRDKSDSRKRKIALDVIEKLWKTQNGVISFQVITELCSVLANKFSVADDMVRREADRLLTWNSIVVDEFVIAEGLRVRQHYGLSYWDSWIVGAAIQARCTLIYSEDLQNGASYHGVTVVNPFAS